MKSKDAIDSAIESAPATTTELIGLGFDDTDPSELTKFVVSSTIRVLFSADSSEFSIFVDNEDMDKQVEFSGSNLTQDEYKRILTTLSSLPADEAFDRCFDIDGKTDCTFEDVSAALNPNNSPRKDNDHAEEEP